MHENACATMFSVALLVCAAAPGFAAEKVDPERHPIGMDAGRDSRWHVDVPRAQAGSLIPGVAPRDAAGGFPVLHPRRSGLTPALVGCSFTRGPRPSFPP
jgi:hypothetical protein